MDAFVHMQLLTLKGWDNAGKTTALELRNIHGYFSLTPTPTLGFLAVFPQVCTRICTFQQSWVKLCRVMCKCSRTAVEENECICSGTAWWGSRSNIDLAVATSVPASLPERSFVLGDLWGSGSILLFQSCVLLRAHLLRVFQEGHGFASTWDAGFWLMCFNWLWWDFVCRNLLELATYSREWATVTVTVKFFVPTL